MTVRFRLPDLGEGVAESEIVRWLVQPGDVLAEDQPMVEVMTDKATVEIPAPSAGTVARLHAQEGQVVPVGTVIVEITRAAGATSMAPDGGSARSTTASSSARAAADTTGASMQGQLGGGASGSASGSTSGEGAGRRVQATPLVRRLAAELGIDLEQVAGSGPNGRIMEEDVRAAGASATGAHAPSTTAPAGALPAGARERIALRGVRRTIADHLTAAQRVPVVTVVEECDLTSLESARARSGLGYLPYLVAAVRAGFDEVPQLNATLDDATQELTLFDQVHMGIAVQTDQGLLVPVLRDCGGLALPELEGRISDLAERARSGSLEPSELRGGTFTITSAGKFGGLFTTPLLNVPEVGILGLHRADDRPVVVDGDIVVRRMANLSVTFDHRALDGILASRFLLTVIAALQAPART